MFGHCFVLGIFMCNAYNSGGSSKKEEELENRLQVQLKNPLKDSRSSAILWKPTSPLMETEFLATYTLSYDVDCQTEIKESMMQQCYNQKYKCANNLKVGPANKSRTPIV